MPDTIAIGPFIQIVTMRNLPLKGALPDEQLEVVENGALIIQNGRIAAMGNSETIRRRAESEGIPWHPIEKPVVAIPGLVDAHTHICYAGSRAKDYAARSAGKTYLEIAQAGGGIWDTVQKTRAASKEALTESILGRTTRLLRSGVTTVEVKSGYALTVEGELKMLRAIEDANQNSHIDIVSTCLPAHIVPKDFGGTAMEYVEHLLADFFPIVQKEKLAKRADIFVEAEAFGLVEARHYLSTLDQLGFDLTVHADQFSTGGSQVAIECQARSADHLEASGEQQIQALAKSEVIPMALPGASLGLGCDFTPGRRLLDAGASLAIASDWNPGSAPMGDLLTCASIFGMAEKLSLAEILAGISFRAAAALGLHDRGRLAAGQIADISAFETSDYREIFYQQGQLRPTMVWKRGRLILS